MEFILNFVLILVLMTITEGKENEFCSSYKNNNYTAMIFSADNKQIFVFIDKDYWILSENNQKVSFIRDDKRSSGREEILGNRFNFVFFPKTLLRDKPTNIFVFYDSERWKESDKMVRMYYENGFNIECSKDQKPNGKPCGILSTPPFPLHTLSQPVVFPVIDKDDPQAGHNLFVIQDTTRQILYASFHILEPNQSFDNSKDIPISKYEGIKEINPNLVIIGIFLSYDSDRLYAFFGKKTGIEYCFIEDCLRNAYQVLIDCSTPLTGSPPPPDKSSNLLPIGLFFGVILVMLLIVIIGSFVVFCIRRNRHEQSGQEIYEFPTIKTVNSETGGKIQQRSSDRNSGSTKKTFREDSTSQTTLS